MTDLVLRISNNLAAIRERVKAAAERSGRQPNEVTLVAVTKYVGIDEIQALVDTGCQDLGESRPQDLWQKVEALPDRSIRWHMIGHLQRNKVRRTVPLAHLIHSGDSQRLLEAIDTVCQEHSTIAKVLLEVNISGDQSKHGFAPESLMEYVTSLDQLKNLEVLGLMGMASFTGGIEQARSDFRRLRKLRDELQIRCPANVTLNELSMGMSGDFEVAIEEGATIVRVGSALFEGLA